MRSRRSRPTLSDIAAETGVSTATVSKMLNGRTDVASATREGVTALLKTHNYPAMGTRRARRSGLVDLATPPSWTSLTAAHHSDGVLLVTSRITAQQRAQVQRAGAALVVIDPVDLPDTDPVSIGATNGAGGLSATEHLISLGRRRIAVIGAPRDTLCTQARSDGYRAALERAGIEVDRDLIRYGDFLHEEGFAAARHPLGRPDRPTAIFAGSDLQATGAYEAARQADLSVPRHLSVVGSTTCRSASGCRRRSPRSGSPWRRWAGPPRAPSSSSSTVSFWSARIELTTELRVRLSTAPPPA